MRTEKLNWVDRLDLAVANGLPPGAIDFVAEDADDDIGSAVELATLRWQLWDERQVDLFDHAPVLRGWKALRKLRILAAGSPFVEVPPGIEGWQEGIRGLFGVVELPEGGSAGWDAGGEMFSFQQDFQAALRTVGVERRFSYALASVVLEMASNAVEHSSAAIASLASFSISGRRWNLSVTDVGQGARQSLGENPQFRGVSTDAQALRLVLRDGVSGTGQPGRGHGFTRVFKSLVDRHAELRFRTGAASASWAGESPTSQLLRVKTLPSRRRGFHVAISGPTDGA